MGIRATLMDSYHLRAGRTKKQSKPSRVAKLVMSSCIASGGKKRNPTCCPAGVTLVCVFLGSVRFLYFNRLIVSRLFSAHLYGNRIPSSPFFYCTDSYFLSKFRNDSIVRSIVCALDPRVDAIPRKRVSSYLFPILTCYHGSIYQWLSGNR